MFRFLLSFLAGFGVVYYLLKKEDKDENVNANPPLKFPPEPDGIESSEKFLNILKGFNKLKKDI